MNEFVGDMVRTKSSSENEGGILGGAAVIDSPAFVQELKPVGESKTEF